MPEQLDLGSEMESVLVLEAEIDTLMRRLIVLDSNAFLRLENLLSKLKVERAVVRHFN